MVLKKGVRAGDIISRINGELINDWTSDEVGVKHLKGPKGTQVTITIRRAISLSRSEMTITRAEIPTNSVRYAFMLTPDTGYIHSCGVHAHNEPRLSSPRSKSSRSRGMKKLPSTSGQPWRRPDSAVDIADVFLDRWQKVVRQCGGRTASSDQDFLAPGNGPIRRAAGAAAIVISPPRRPKSSRGRSRP